MFIGKFTNDHKTTSQFYDEVWHGVFCNKDAIRFSNECFATLFYGIIYNKESLGLNSIINDAEAVTILYQKYGISGFSKLDGSFTIIVMSDQQTLIIRDHHGTDSQVYFNNTHFASSLSSLRKISGYKDGVNNKALGTFLSAGYIPTCDTAFKNIHKLAAGSVLTICNGNYQITKLFDTSTTILPHGKQDLEALSERYGELHTQAIKRRIGNSNNVGILLSGGYDSGSNLAALRQVYGGNIQSFSVGFKGDNWSELPLAKCMSQTFNTIHHQYEIDGSEILSLPDIIKNLGDPFVEGGLMVNYAAMRMVGMMPTNEITATTDISSNDSIHKPDVIIGGDGSDQYFGTSAREIAIRFLAAKYGMTPILGIVHSILSNEIFDRNTPLYRVRFQLTKILNLLDGDIFGFEPFMLKKILKNIGSMPSSHNMKCDCTSFDNLYNQHACQTDIDKTIDQVILFKASRMAEMFNNNMTFPFMDLELYNFIRELPVEYKCKNDSIIQVAKGDFTAKFLLKYHYKPMLPEVITARKKQGGFAPMSIFFDDKKQRNKLADFILQSSVTNEFLNRWAVENFITTYDRQSSQNDSWFWYKQNKAIQYFNLLTLAIWWEEYVKLRNVDLL